MKRLVLTKAKYYGLKSGYTSFLFTSRKEENCFIQCFCFDPHHKQTTSDENGANVANLVPNQNESTRLSGV